MSRDWTEDQIAALVDGSIEDKAEAAALQRVLDSDPAARAYAEQLRRSNDLLRQAFEIPADEPTPAAIEAAIFGEPGKVEVFRPKRGFSQWTPTAIAASLALLIGLGAGNLFFGGGSGDPVIATLGDAPLDGPLHAALESLPSGTRSEAGVQPMLSFYDGNGRPCREFEVTGELPAELEFGVACRGETGNWHVEIMVTAPATEPGPDGFVPASGAGGSALDSMLDALGAGPALAPEDEAVLLKGGWRKAR